MKKKMMFKKVNMFLVLVLTIFMLNACFFDKKETSEFVIENDIITGLSEEAQSLSEIVIPEKVNGKEIKRIASGAFVDANNLKTIVTSEEVTFMEGSLFDFNNLTIVIENKTNKVTFEGGGNIHKNISIQLKTIKTSGLTLVFEDFRYVSVPGKPALSSTSTGTVNIESLGVENTLTSLSGAEGIRANNVTFNMSGSAVFKIIGGNGSEGYDGASGIVAKNITLKDNVNLQVTGGNGGNGVSGSKGIDGGNGGQGGNGGDGAPAIDALTLDASNGKIIVTSGNGGNGGNGGEGGQGVAGSEGRMDLGGKSWSDGKDGSVGGTGGNGGNAGGSKDPLVVDHVIGDSNITFRKGVTGNGGNGGQGGQGGSGGNGASSGTVFIDTPYGLNAGNGGQGGNGGNGGNGRVAGQAGLAGLAGEGGSGTKKTFGLFQQFDKVGNNGSPGQPGQPGESGNVIS